MEEHHISPLLAVLSFAPIFLVVISLIREITKITKFPYTIALLIAGFITQIVVHFFHLPLELVLGPEMIYFVLLPILLFEATIHLNIHQFKLQFLTISFISTFGLLVSMFIVGAGVAYFTGIPFTVALLFGALISATDPIAVLALFKTLGAPKRLALIADGESMFNDATAVIAFRIVSSFALASSAAFETQKIFAGFGQFLYIFVGSIILGFVLGYVTSLALAYIKKDKLTETALTMVLAFGSFYFSEHLFALSGVITCVIAGITLGNLGKTKISEGTMPFVEEVWEYVGFIALSIVFFFAAYNLDFGIFEHDLPVLPYVILSVLVARAVSVYVSFYLSNNMKLFKDEPNVPMSWQHIINWGGLRGVIPLVLVLSLPDSFEYKGEILAFTMASLLFTLFVNGLTIENILKRLKLHVPKNEEELVNEESSISEFEELRKKLDGIRNMRDFDLNIVKKMDIEILKDEKKHKVNLELIAKKTNIETGLMVECLKIEKSKLFEMYNEGYIPESVYFTFEAQLDLQEDALEYPEVYTGRGYTGGGYLHTERSFRLRMSKFRELVRTLPFLKSIFTLDEKVFVQNRYALLRARLVTSYSVYEYLARIQKMFRKNGVNKAAKKVMKTYKKFEKNNLKELNHIKNTHGRFVQDFQEKTLHSIIARELSLVHSPSH